jgi:hypothetical protein
MKQSGNVVHSSVHALSVVLGEEMRYDNSDALVAGLAFDFGDAPVLVCRHHESFPESLCLTLHVCGAVTGWWPP